MDKKILLENPVQLNVLDYSISSKHSVSKRSNIISFRPIINIEEKKNKSLSKPLFVGFSFLSLIVFYRYLNN